MEDFKIQHFEAEHGVGAFPSFRKLNPEELKGLRDDITRELGFSSAKTGADLVGILDAHSIPVSEVNAEADDFSLLELLRRLDLRTEQKLLLNWSQFDDVDEFFVGDIGKYFDDIWYPGPDDIDLISPDLSWILSIDHSGYVKVLRRLNGSA